MKFTQSSACIIEVPYTVPGVIKICQRIQNIYIEVNLGSEDEPE